jgi:hypothetical protein
MTRILTQKESNRLSVIRAIKSFRFVEVLRLVCNGSGFDTNCGIPFWTFKKGESFDYTNALPILPVFIREEDGWNLFPMIKPEGAPVQIGMETWEGAIKIGDWWSIKFQTKWFHIYYRHRSWTTDIFYISKGVS